MKKLVMAGAILATSMGAMADNTTHDGIITNLTNIYTGLNGTWGSAQSNGATTALASLFSYADSVSGATTAPTVSYSSTTGFSLSAGNIGFSEADFDAEIDGVVAGVSTDLFGTGDLATLALNTDTTGGLVFQIGSDTTHDDSTTYSAVSGLAAVQITNGLTAINVITAAVDADPLAVSQTQIDAAFNGATAAFSVVNSAFTGLASISSLNDGEQGASVVSGYQLGATDAGVVTHNSLTYCSYEDYAKGISSDPADC